MGINLKLPKAVTLRAQLRRELAGDADAVAWMKENTYAVDRMLADAVFGATVTALSEVTGFSPEQVRDRSGSRSAPRRGPARPCWG